MTPPNILLLLWSLSAMLLTISSIYAAPPIGQADVEQAITDVQAGGDLAKADLVRNLIELGNRRADEATKIQSIDSCIRLGAAILKTRDRSIDTNAKVGIWPAFDALAHGGKFPVFAGTDPASITDASLRKAYEDALTRQKETLASFSKERQKEEAASEAFAACKRLLMEMNTQTADERVKQSLAKLADDPWVAARVTTALYPHAESKSAEGQPTPNGRDISSLNPSAAAGLTPTTPSKEPTPPWSLIVVLIASAIGLLWLARKRRA